jgi:hypothetical protein
MVILIRIRYQFGEVGDLWSPRLTSHETVFHVLDGVMILIANLILTVFHRGRMVGWEVDNDIRGMSPWKRVIDRLIGSKHYLGGN